MRRPWVRRTASAPASSRRHRSCRRRSRIPITINIGIDYSGIGGGASAGPKSGLIENYSTVKADLTSAATFGDPTFDTLPSGSVQGQTQIAVWDAQLKLLGMALPSNYSGVDGNANFTTDIDPSLLVGVAVHELTHALGRVPYGPPYGSQPDIFDLFRFTSAGNQLIAGAPRRRPLIFPIDGGNTKLADFGQNSDSSDFLNSGVQGPNDPFNEYYTGSTLQGLTAVDKEILDALGFHLTSPVVTVMQTDLSTSLVLFFGDYYLQSTSGGIGTSLKYAGTDITPSSFGGWVPIGAVASGAGYEVAWKLTGADQYTVWNTDSNGNYVSPVIGTVSGSSSTLVSLENTFHQDLNGDGVIGIPLPDLTAAFDRVSNTTIAAGGSTSVDFWVVNFGNATAAASTSGLYLSTTPTITTADTLLTTVASPALTADGTPGYYDHQTVALTLPGNLAPGTYYIGGIADYNNAVAESNQIGHNHDVTQITVPRPALPDLTAAFDHVSNTTIAAGGSTQLTSGSSISAIRRRRRRARAFISRRPQRLPPPTRCSPRLRRRR